MAVWEVGKIVVPADAGQLWTAVAALATLAAVAVALLPEFKKWWVRPRLRIIANLKQPGCHQTVALDAGAPAQRRRLYILRLWVENIGRGPAENVQLFVQQLEKQNAARVFEREESFLPMNLRWTHTSEGSSPFADRINPSMGRFCELASVQHPEDNFDPQTLVSLTCEVTPLWQAGVGHILDPGVYRLTIRAAGSNARPQDTVIELTSHGKWYDDQRKMFSDSLGLKNVVEESYSR